MSHRNSFSVVVQGGSVNENRMITSIIQGALASHGFTNVFSDHDQSASSSDLGGMSILDLVRHKNPDLLDTPIMIMGQGYEEITEEEISVNNQYTQSAFGGVSLFL